MNANQILEAVGVTDYTEQNAGFALSSLLLMAPGLLSEAVFDLLGVVGVTVSVDALVLDLTLRAAGLVVFAALTAQNRRKVSTTREQAEPTSA